MSGATAGPSGAGDPDAGGVEALDPARPGVAYWRERARALGARAVVNVDHPDEADLGDVTDGHREALWPLLAAELTGDEQVVLDVGCGTGRLTADLAALVDGDAIGVDPVAGLLALAEPHARVDLRLMTEGRLPVDDDAVDVVFTSLVLGGIPAVALERTIAEMRRVLRPGGLVFLSESVADRPEPGHWAARTVDDYRELLPWVTLREVGRFDDAGDGIAVLAGRA
ncbi:class I SAM-dependent methyltransferase [Patulibacter sp.]|uniref:class I SAM-dependent methyltransferase n=1 Tax=Patulibacter sp. TaxID=1912859 RepID=UPI00271DD6B3|nr:class I SAM-dependent methyltransferase [Patulibacter sp.]MDO9406993.1 class I SAM-dependent methyltransferase [Patulibacter sp.]